MLIYGGVGLLIVAAAGFVTIVLVSRAKLGATFEQPVKALPLQTGQPDAIARGEYLVENLLSCGHAECHRPDFGGGAVIDAQPMGLVYAPNLTAGRGSVTRGYTAEDWARTIRHGLTRSGRRALVMPSEDYVRFSDADLAAAVAYIESLPPVDRETPPHRPGPLLRFLLTIGAVQFAYDKIDHAAAPPDATPGATREWGAVLIGTCIGCHGEGLSGGPIPGGDPTWPPARNISPDQATGIGAWSFGDFENALRRGKRPDGTDVRSPMPWQIYSGMSDQDLRALWEYIRAAPPKPEGGR
ncbi:MAG: c-type cytochrome [Acidobacteria bacterium]|nr:c-type cytochrome [Acidobacteriota bacterium]